MTEVNHSNKGCFCERAGHRILIFCVILFKEDRGFCTFDLENPQNAQCSMNYCENLEDDAGRNPDSGGLAYEVPKGSKNCIIDLCEIYLNQESVKVARSDGSVVRSSVSTSRGPRFDFQNSYWQLTTILSLVKWDMMLSTGFLWYYTHDTSTEAEKKISTHIK